MINPRGVSMDVIKLQDEVLQRIAAYRHSDRNLHTLQILYQEKRQGPIFPKHPKPQNVGV